jgi:CRISPR-associated protein Csd1
MSWLGDLCETYDQCQSTPKFADEPLNPIASMYQTTHICIRLDGEGAFLGAEFARQDRTLIPVTESSSGRSGKNPAPHPFSDKLRYCAGDFEKWTGERSRFQDYHRLLASWCDSQHAHAKATAVRRYVEKKTMVADLVREGVLHTQNRSRLSVKRPKTKLNPPIDDQGDALIRWRVESPPDQFQNAWEDASLFSSWIAFENTLPSLGGTKKRENQGVCLASGQENTRLAHMHPRGIRFSSDGAKIISSNDENGFTFRGRFRSSDEACGVSFNVTQKAHNALRWLIALQRDSSRSAEQVFVSWAIGGQDIPDLQKNTGQLFLAAPLRAPSRLKSEASAEMRFALRLDTLISSYDAKLRPSDWVVVMGLNSATPGRMAITFYRKMTGPEFLERIQTWHERFAWWQSYPAEKSGTKGQSPARYSNAFVGTPAPREIAEAACGLRAQGMLGEKLIRATVERLLACIVDGRPFPKDILDSCLRRASNRTEFKDRRVASLKEFEREREWKRVLGIACGLYKGVQNERGYLMSLEENRTSRDYLFGRMLAIAENIENHSLEFVEEKRDTNAARSMQRFADRPCSTWRHIELALVPYRAQLRRHSPAVLDAREKLLDSVIGSFRSDEFVREDKLSGEFLLGYHSQRADLWRAEEADAGATTAAEDSTKTGKEQWAHFEKKLILR